MPGLVRLRFPHPGLLLPPGCPVNLTREEKSWVLYDVANSAFVLVVTTALMPVFYKGYAAAGRPPAVATGDWGLANALAALLLALSAPLVGTLADYPGGKKRFFRFFLLVGVLCCLLFATVERGAWSWCLLLYLLARVGFGGANLLYDAMLVDVTTPGRMDRVSAAGYGWGYIGSVLPFVVVLAMVLPAAGGDGLPPGRTKAGFLLVGLWWLAFSLPLLRYVRQRHALVAPAAPLAAAWQRLRGLLAEVRRCPQAFRFLLAYFCYIDGVDTIIVMAMSYGMDAGLSTRTLVLAILVIQVVAFPCTLAYGRLAQRLSCRGMLLAGIGVFACTTGVAFVLPLVPGPGYRQGLFWVLALLVASSMGGVQSLSRSFFSQLVPPERSGGFFGLYNVCGKSAAILGPLVMGLAARVGGHARYGVPFVLFLLLLGAWLLATVRPAASRCQHR